MNKDQFDREARYWTMAALSKELFGKGLITAADVDAIHKMMAEICPSMIALIGS